MRLASRKRLLIAVTSLTLGAGVLAADLVKPNIKPGLWEVSNSPQFSGQLSIPEEDLAKLSPEQRARMEAALKNATSNMKQPHVYKECMTPEKIARGFDIDRSGNDSSCTRKVVSSSASELTLHDECNQTQRKTVSDVHFEIQGGTQASGKIHVVMTSADGKTMTVNSTIQGKWLGASCGSVKDHEVEK
jgi:Protein of unknown function (DUF3617)